MYKENDLFNFIKDNINFLAAFKAYRILLEA